MMLVKHKGKSLNFEYLGPIKPQIILKIIRVPAIAPKAAWKLMNSSCSPRSHEITIAAASIQWIRRDGNVQIILFAMLFCV